MLYCFCTIFRYYTYTYIRSYRKTTDKFEKCHFQSTNYIPIYTRMYFIDEIFYQKAFYSSTVGVAFLSGEKTITAV